MCVHLLASNDLCQFAELEIILRCCCWCISTGTFPFVRTFSPNRNIVSMTWLDENRILPSCRNQKLIVCLSYYYRCCCYRAIHADVDVFSAVVVDSFLFYFRMISHYFSATTSSRMNNDSEFGSLSAF